MSDLAENAFYATGAVIAGAFVMGLVRAALQGINFASSSSFAKSFGEIGGALQPLFGYLKPLFESAFGPLGSFKSTPDHVLLAAILFVLVCIYNQRSVAPAASVDAGSAAAAKGARGNKKD